MKPSAQLWPSSPVSSGLVLSAFMLVPSIRWTPVSAGAWLMHAVLFIFVAAPFLLLGAMNRSKQFGRYVPLLAVPYLVCHVIVDGTLLFGSAQAPGIWLPRTRACAVLRVGYRIADWVVACRAHRRQTLDAHFDRDRRANAALEGCMKQRPSRTSVTV
jgi:hypothetical protein